MLYSMTGYGKSENKNEELSITVEVKTLNSKEINLNIKMPHYLKSNEWEIRNIIQQNLQRGKIDVYIDIQLPEHLSIKKYNADSIKTYYIYLKQLVKELNIDDTQPYIHAILFKDAANMANTETLNENEIINENNKQLLLKTINHACEMVNQFRMNEGEKLEQDILNHIQLLDALRLKIKEIEPLRTIKIKEKIINHLKEYTETSKINYERLEQEIVYYLEKLDINEELIRLNSHLNYFRETCKDGYGKGRKLIFITQEIGREINTIGSKANDEQIQKLVVEMKDILEKIKEQLNNIL